MIKSEHCIVTPNECNHVSTCRYLLDRFGVFECENNEFKRLTIESGYEHELQERAKLETWSERKDYLVKETK
ncbi:MAG: hypothetical protein E7F84_04380 [Clostridium butyricum]|nr:hypothetical protein [Clostridium butyricum]